MKSDKFRSFVDRLSADPRCEGLEMAAFLLTPIQRLPRYVLLLNNLLKVCCVNVSHLKTSISSSHLIA